MPVKGTISAQYLHTTSGALSTTVPLTALSIPLNSIILTRFRTSTCTRRRPGVGSKMKGRPELRCCGLQDLPVHRPPLKASEMPPHPSVMAAAAVAARSAPSMTVATRTAVRPAAAAAPVAAATAINLALLEDDDAPLLIVRPRVMSGAADGPSLQPQTLTLNVTSSSLAASLSHCEKHAPTHPPTHPPIIARIDRTSTHTHRCTQRAP